MSNVGINIWTLGNALENPQLSGAAPITQDTTFGIGDLHVQGGDYETSNTYVDLGDLYVQSFGKGARAEFSAGSLHILSADYEYSEAQYTLGNLRIQGESEDDPGLQGGALVFQGISIGAQGFPWVIGNADYTTGPLQVLAGDYAYAEGEVLLGELHVDANGAPLVPHGLIFIPGLAADSGFTMVSETVEVGSSIDLAIQSVVEEILGVADTPSTLGELQADVLEELFAKSVEIVPIALYIAEDLGAGADEPLTAYKMAGAIEEMTAEAGEDSHALLNLTFATALTIQDAVDQVENLTFEEVVGLVADDVASLKANFDLLEQIGAEAQVAGNVILLVDSEESALLDGTASTLATLQATIEEGAALYVSVRAGEDEIHGWVMHPDNLAFSEYRNFPFNSLTAVNGRHFAVAEDGLYELTGDDDAGEPIEAAIQTGLMDLGTHFIKDAKAAYLGYTASGKLVLKVVTTAKGQKEEWWYQLKQGSAPSLRDGRVTIGRGLRAKYWQFEVVNADGADFELDDIQVMYNILSRRIR